MQGSQEPQMGDINCGEEIGKLPFWTRVIYFSLGASWLMSLFGMSGLLGSNEAIVFREYRLWTLITANLFVDWLFLLFIVIYNFHTFLPALQTKLSSPLLLLKFLLNGLIIQTLTVIIQSLVFQTDPTSPIYNTVCGVWFNMVFKYCYFNRERKIKFCCFAWKFKRVYYPFVMLAVCTVLTFRLPIQMLVGLILGVLQVKIQKVNSFPASFLATLAQKMNLSSVSCWIRFGSVTDSLDYSDEWCYSGLDDFSGLNLVPKNSPDNSMVNDSFASKKGVRLGDC